MSKREMMQVGIDLGTSQSAISVSSGKEAVVSSYVGWAVDIVARKALGKKILVGDEAIENRTMVELHRPLERGTVKEGSKKDLEAVREIVTYLLNEVGVDPKKQSIRGVVGVPAEAMRVSKVHLRETLEGIIDRLLVISEPFAVAYGINALVNSMIIDLGAGTTDFCLMLGRYPTEDDQKTIYAAGDYIDRQLETVLRERYPEARFTIFMVREWKEKYGFVGEPKRRVEVKTHVSGKPVILDITEEMKMACESILMPISEALHDLIARLDPEYHEKIRNNIYLSGRTSLLPGLPQAIEAMLEDVGGGKVKRVDDPSFAGVRGCLAVAKDADDEEWEMLAGV